MARGFVRWVLSALVTLCVWTSATASAEPINAVLGDESWEVRFGEAPIEGQADEVERIKTHLHHVVSVLRAREAHGHHLARRAWLLDRLTDYADAGRFPSRTLGDGHGVRQPRFIGANGVHCAVGEMLRVSGHSGLARRIDRDHRFDLVADIDTPELTSWARDWGFTPAELAMIQPAYTIAAPTAESTLETLESMRNRVVLACGKDHPVQPEVAVRLRGDTRPFVYITPIDLECGFAACAAREFQKAFAHTVPQGDDIMYTIDPSTIAPFDSTATLTMPSPAEVYAHRLDHSGLAYPDNTCTHAPEPNPIIERVTVRLRSDAEGVSYEVTTSPPSPLAQACIEKDVAQRVWLEAGLWEVDVVKTFEVEPLVTQRRFENVMHTHDNRIQELCAKHGMPTGRWRIKVDASRATQSMSVEVTGGDEAFTECMESTVRAIFTGELNRGHMTPDRTYVQYVRYDADASVERAYGRSWVPRWWELPN